MARRAHTQKYSTGAHRRRRVCCARGSVRIQLMCLRGVVRARADRCGGRTSAAVEEGVVGRGQPPPSTSSDGRCCAHDLEEQIAALAMSRKAAGRSHQCCFPVNRSPLWGGVAYFGFPSTSPTPLRETTRERTCRVTDARAAIRSSRSWGAAGDVAAVVEAGVLTSDQLPFLDGRRSRDRPHGPRERATSFLGGT